MRIFLVKSNIQSEFSVSSEKTRGNVIGVHRVTIVFLLLHTANSKASFDVRGLTRWRQNTQSKQTYKIDFLFSFVTTPAFSLFQVPLLSYRSLDKVLATRTASAEFILNLFSSFPLFYPRKALLLFLLHLLFIIFWGGLFVVSYKIHRTITLNHSRLGDSASGQNLTYCAFLNDIKCKGSRFNRLHESKNVTR